jgi:hypothetical protein
MVSDEVLFFGTKRSEEGMRRVMRSNEVRQQFGASISEATLRPNFWGSKIHEKRCDEANVRDVAIKGKYLLESRD